MDNRWLPEVKIEQSRSGDINKLFIAKLQKPDVPYCIVSIKVSLLIIVPPTSILMGVCFLHLLNSMFMIKS